MPSPKKILIVDENSFSKVCSAILTDEGYQTKCVMSAQEAVKHASGRGISLIVSSYPFAKQLLKSKEIRDVPTIILSDDLNSDLLNIMKPIKNSVCMMKPLDFDRFKFVVRGAMKGYMNFSGGNVIA